MQGSKLLCWSKFRRGSVLCCSRRRRFITLRMGKSFSERIASSRVYRNLLLTIPI